MIGKTKFKDTDMQVVIGWVLRIGVFTSIAIVFLGGILYLYRHGNTVPDYTKFTGVPDFVKVNNIIEGILNLRGQSIIQAGVILLIATPILRIVFSVIGFAIEKDYLYIGISLLVLLIIISSAVSGHAG